MYTLTLQQKKCNDLIAENCKEINQFLGEKVYSDDPIKQSAQIIISVSKNFNGIIENFSKLDSNTKKNKFIENQYNKPTNE